MEGIHFGRWEIADRSPSTLGVGPLKPTPAHPIHSLRDGLVPLTRGDWAAPRWEMGECKDPGLRTKDRCSPQRGG